MTPQGRVASAPQWFCHFNGSSYFLIYIRFHLPVNTRTGGSATLTPGRAVTASVDETNEARLGRPCLKDESWAPPSFKTTAEELHFNSVKYRMQRATERRARPVDDDRRDAEGALVVCHLTPRCFRGDRPSAEPFTRSATPRVQVEVASVARPPPHAGTTPVNRALPSCSNRQEQPLTRSFIVGRAGLEPATNGL